MKHKPSSSPDKILYSTCIRRPVDMRAFRNNTTESTTIKLPARRYRQLFRPGPWSVTIRPCPISTFSGASPACNQNIKCSAGCTDGDYQQTPATSQPRAAGHQRLTFSGSDLLWSVEPIEPVDWAIVAGKTASPVRRSQWESFYGRTGWHEFNFSGCYFNSDQR